MRPRSSRAGSECSGRAGYAVIDGADAPGQPRCRASAAAMACHSGCPRHHCPNFRGGLVTLRRVIPLTGLTSSSPSRPSYPMPSFVFDCAMQILCPAMPFPLPSLCTSLAFRCPWLPCPSPAICFLKLVCGAPSDHIHLATLRVRHGSIGCDTLNEHGDASCEG